MTPSQRRHLLSLLLFCLLITFGRGQFNECTIRDSNCQSISGYLQCSLGFESACPTPLTADCYEACNVTSMSSRFIYVNDKVNFSAAIQGCIHMDMQLATIQNSTEARTVAALCNQNGNGLCWIGFFRNHNEEDFQWIDASHPTDYVSWSGNNPNVSLTSSACASVNGRSAMWIDLDCNGNMQLPFICEPPRFITTSPPANNIISSDGNYIYVHIAMTWQDAENYCISTYNTNLASIHNQAEKDEVKAVCEAGVGGYNHCWLGFNDLDTEGEWVWSDGSGAVDCSVWSVGCGGDTYYEDCGEYATQWRLNDAPCWVKLYFVCNNPN